MNADAANYFATMRERIRLRDAAIATLPEQSTALADADGRTFYVVMRDHYDLSRFRTSRFDAHGAAGHTVNATFAGAVRDALEFGAKLDTAIPVNPSNVDAVAAGFGLTIGSAGETATDADRAYLDEIARRHG